MFLAIVLLTALTTTAQPKEKIAKKKILIVHSSGELAERTTKRVTAHFRHFPVSIRSILHSNYKKKLINKYDVLVYLGVKYERPKKSFLKDVENTRKPVIWIYRNISYLVNKSAGEKYSFYVRGFSNLEYVKYKGVLLPDSSGRIGNVRLTRSKVRVFAQAISKKGKLFPYIVRSKKNFTYFAGNPFAYKQVEGSSTFAFADYLHNVVDNHKAQRRALVRIEDVDPTIDIAKVKLMVDYLYFNNVPFAISVIPAYKESTNSKLILAHEKPQFVKFLKYAKARGAVLVLHGYTHQVKGKTAYDAEFWDLKAGVPINRGADNERRIKAAVKEMKRIGLEPKIWETPHYAASSSTRKIFAEYFRYAFERQDVLVPYPIENEFGQKVIPETSGYPSSHGTLNTSPNSIINNARRTKVVRDGYASFFIHPFLPTDYLIKIVEGIRAQGWQFVSPNKVISQKVITPKKPFVLDRIIFSFFYFINYVLLKFNFWIIISFLFITYYFVIFGLSFWSRLREKNRQPNRSLFFVFVVPALNEEKVIKDTLLSLLSIRTKKFMVLVINDYSEDNTEAIVRSIKSKHLKVLNTKPPDARKGKGNALNLAYRYICKLPLVKKYGRDNVIVSVVDSDGRLDPNITKVVSSYFSNDYTAAVQTPVRIRNCDQNILTKWQDFEFRVFSYMFQSARELIGSVGLGGNGQFVRLSALDSLGKAPWTDCLTEDLDVGIRLILKGWRNRYCSKTYVSQQAVPNFRALVNQRTRWFQGHLSCWRHLQGIATSRLPIFTKLDVTYYLLAVVLAFFVIPANIFVLGYAGYVLINAKLLHLVVNIYGFKPFLLTYLLYFGALPIFIFSYWRSKKQSFIKAVLLTHIYLLVSVVWLFAAYMAVFKIGRKNSKWAKTPRWEG